MSFFDPTNIDRNGSIIPNGVYMALINKVLQKNAGVSIQFTILEKGEQNNKNFWQYFHLAESFGQLKFARLLDAVGMGNAPLDNPLSLEQKVLKIEVGSKVNKQSNELENELKKSMILDEEDLHSFKAIKTPRQQYAESLDDVPF